MNVRGASLVLLSLLAAGCGFLSRTKSRFFTLDVVAPSSAIVDVRGLPIGIDVVELPPGLDRREFVITKADNQLEIRERDQWSASLEPLILHTLAHNLARRLPGGMIILPGQPVPNGPKRSIDVVVEKLAAGPDNAIHLELRWNLRERDQLISSTREQISIETSSLESASVASALSQALSTLSDRIAARVGAG